LKLYHVVEVYPLITTLTKTNIIAEKPLNLKHSFGPLVQENDLKDID
jgi:hypothetical protein